MSDVPSSGGSSSAAPTAPTSSGGASSSSPASAASKTPTGTTTAGGSASSQPAPSGKRSIADQVKKEPAAPAAAVPGKESPAEKARRMAKIKVDGVESEIDFDAIPVEELAYRYQMSEAASKRMQEAADLRKKFNDIVEYGKTNTADAIKQLWGADFDTLAEEHIAKRFEDAQMPEHERKQRDLEARLAQYEKADTDRKSNEERTAKEKYEQEVWHETEQSFVESLNELGYDKSVASSVLPLMVDLADASLANGMDLDPKRLAYETQKRLQTISQHSVRGLKGDKLLSFLGDDAVKEVLNATIAKHRTAATPTAAPTPAPAPTKDPSKPKESMSSRQFLKKHLYGA